MIVRYANSSTVANPEDAQESILPFGFVQSPIIASLCLFKSTLGKYLENIHKRENVIVSVYVDDIIVSSSSEDVLKQIKAEIHVAADKAGFVLNAAKEEGPATSITAFNIILAHNSLEVSEGRMTLFKADYESAASESVQRGIAGYVSSVNETQSSSLSMIPD
ncbi:hypothetical protein INP77_07765 [Methylophilus sp. 13]|uniref:reverse transcriptase domain-containing protein n=1 Tax=Methylophilus sp. 13 TaxID=2781018 RepID=UPI0018905498|nr:reverse transcriptase domain-containing protein [Methylophilus sp. 13]MBF5039384.1 hypothetical protein [Methylophilus sp. 13]